MKRKGKDLLRMHGQMIDDFLALFSELLATTIRKRNEGGHENESYSRSFRTFVMVLSFGLLFFVLSAPSEKQIISASTSVPKPSVPLSPESVHAFLLIQPQTMFVSQRIAQDRTIHRHRFPFSFGSSSSSGGSSSGLPASSASATTSPTSASSSSATAPASRTVVGSVPGLAGAMLSSMTDDQRGVLSPDDLCLLFHVERRQHEQLVETEMRNKWPDSSLRELRMRLMTIDQNPFYNKNTFVVRLASHMIT